MSLERNDFRDICKKVCSIDDLFDQFLRDSLVTMQLAPI